MTRHGWVTPLSNGEKARCGGPGLCAHCKAERVATETPFVPVLAQGGQETRMCWLCMGEFRHESDCPWPPFFGAFS